MKITRGEEAVFARNHREYLNHAVEVANLDPRSLVTFRSRQYWKGALKLLEDNAELPIYFGVVGGGPEVLYRANLRQVHLNPEQDNEVTSKFLKFVPPSTTGEGLWEGKVKTLYAISGCYKLDNSFPITSLVKLSDGMSISQEFKYSYSLVNRKNETPSIENVASDIAEPPSRTDVRVNRIIRDTTLIQRLKKIHNGQCQRCNARLELPDGSAYSEGHHLKPLGSPHNGPDVAENVLILCPNCHALLDLAAVQIELENLRPQAEHPVGMQFITYHNDMTKEKMAKPRRA